MAIKQQLLDVPDYHSFTGAESNPIHLLSTRDLTSKNYAHIAEHFIDAHPSILAIFMASKLPKHLAKSHQELSSMLNAHKMQAKCMF